MKKSTMQFLPQVIITVILLSGCGTSSNDMENNRNKTSAADQEYQSDVTKCSNEFMDKASGNDTTFDNFETKLEEQNKDSKEANEKILAGIKKRNSDLEGRLEDYKEQGKEYWITFKADINARIDSIDKEYRDLTISNDQIPVQTADKN